MTALPSSLCIVVLLFKTQSSLWGSNKEYWLLHPYFGTKVASSPRSAAAASALVCSTWHGTTPCQAGWERDGIRLIRSTDHQVVWVFQLPNSPDSQGRAVINCKEKSCLLLYTLVGFLNLISYWICTNTIKIQDIRFKLVLGKARVTEFLMKW